MPLTLNCTNNKWFSGKDGVSGIKDICPAERSDRQSGIKDIRSAGHDGYKRLQYRTVFCNYDRVDRSGGRTADKWRCNKGDAIAANTLQAAGQSVDGQCNSA